MLEQLVTRVAAYAQMLFGKASDLETCIEQELFMSELLARMYSASEGHTG